METPDKSGHQTRHETQHWVVDFDNPQLESHPAVREAAERLRRGEVVAFPTETVYGLGANCFSSKAVRRIFAAKGRPSDNPLIVHIAEKAWLYDLVSDLPVAARRLMEAFWPGPLTLILPSNGRVAPEVTAGLSTVAVRMPDHPVALALLRACGFPLAAPSANRSGRPSPTRAEHVLDDLAGRIAGVLDSGPVSIGTESTVVDVSRPQPVILRPGGITRQALEEVLKQPVIMAGAADTASKVTDRPLDAAHTARERGNAAGGDAGDVAVHKAMDPDDVPRSPGMKYTHYAPRGELWLVDGALETVQAYIAETARALAQQGKRVGVMTTEESVGAYRRKLSDAPVTILACGRRSDLSTVARDLYGCLRRFDDAAVELIYAEAFPAAGIGEAIMNRLEKASGGRRINL